MHHLDVVTSTIITNPLTTWVSVVAIRLGSDALEDILDVWPGLLVSTGHQRGTISGTLLTTGNTGTDESNALIGQVLCAAVGIGEMRVTTIDDDVAFLAVGEEGLDEVVDRLSGHDQEHHTAGFLELADKLFDRVGTFDRLACRHSTLANIQFAELEELTLGLVGEEVVNLRNGTVEGNDVEAVIGSVQDQVLTHDSQADEAEISSGFIVSMCGSGGRARDSVESGSSNVDAGQARSGCTGNAIRGDLW